MSRILKGLVLGVVLVAVGALLIWAFLEGREELARERERELPIKIPPRVSRTAAGDIVLTLDPETQARIGLKTQALSAESLRAELPAYGRLQEDPALSFTVRTPVAGVLRSNSRAWPVIGELLSDGTAFGDLDPRLSPVERVDLQARLAAARADVEALQASRMPAQASFERARVLNAEDKNLSDRALQEAEARVKGEEARLAAARESVRQLEVALASTSGNGHLLPLSSGGGGGEVVEVLAQPGETVENGQPILRLARFERLIARIDLPAGEAIDSSVATARILALGHEDQPLRGGRISLAAAIDPKTLGQGLLFRVSPNGVPLRPGAAVMAYLPLPGKQQAGVMIPPSAVVRYGGKAWAYAQVEGDKFARREVALEQRTDNGWFVTSIFVPGDRVVVAGAQVLLSEEMKSQIQILEEAEK